MRAFEFWLVLGQTKHGAPCPAELNSLQNCKDSPPVPAPVTKKANTRRMRLGRDFGTEGLGRGKMLPEGFDFCACGDVVGKERDSSAEQQVKGLFYFVRPSLLVCLDMQNNPSRMRWHLNTGIRPNLVSLRSFKGKPRCKGPPATHCRKGNQQDLAFLSGSEP